MDIHLHRYPRIHHVCIYQQQVNRPLHWTYDACRTGRMRSIGWRFSVSCTKIDMQMSCGEPTNQLSSAPNPTWPLHICHEMYWQSYGGLQGSISNPLRSPSFVSVSTIDPLCELERYPSSVLICTGHHNELGILVLIVMASSNSRGVV